MRTPESQDVCWTECKVQVWDLYRRSCGLAAIAYKECNGHAIAKII